MNVWLSRCPRWSVKILLKRKGQRFYILVKEFPQKSRPLLESEWDSQAEFPGILKRDGMHTELERGGGIGVWGGGSEGNLPNDVS